MNKQIAMYARNSSSISGIQSCPPLVPPCSLITSNTYLLVSQTIRLCSFCDHNLSRRPSREGSRPYRWVYPGSGLINSKGGFTYVLLSLFHVESPNLMAICSASIGAPGSPLLIPAPGTECTPSPEPALHASGTRDGPP
jgi:hypothetical protein